jgi:dihydroorotate dehydrogenase (NAD+) catalytic subunit
VWELSRAVKIPIIGIGGVSTWQDAVEYLLAGASAVQVGTASFVDPRAAKHILDGLASYCSQRGTTPEQLTGAMI